MFDFFWKFLYNLVKTIFYCIDFMLNFAKMLAGIDTVVVKGEETDLLAYFLGSQPVMDAFKLIAMVGVVLLFSFTVFSVIRSVARYGEEKTVSGVCFQAGKTLIYFFLVPVFMLAGALCVSAIGEAVFNATSNGSAGLGSSLFSLVAEEAYDGGGNKGQVLQYFREQAPGYNYYSTSNVNTHFDLSEINYFLAFVGGIATLILIAKPMMTFVERIVSLVLLFVVAPISVSSAILDDGARFKLWRDQVINKFLIAYGTLISINIFMILIQIVYTVEFFPDDTFLNGLARLVFVIGGAGATNMGSVVIGNLINSGAGSQFAQDAHNVSAPMARLGHMATHAAGKVTRTAGGLAMKPVVWGGKTLGKKGVDRVMRGYREKQALQEKAHKIEASEKHNAIYNKKLAAHQAKGGTEENFKDWRKTLFGGSAGGGSGSSGGSGVGAGGGSNSSNEGSASGLNQSGASTIKDALGGSSSRNKNGDEGGSK